MDQALARFAWLPRLLRSTHHGREWSACRVLVRSVVARGLYRRKFRVFSHRRRRTNPPVAKPQTTAKGTQKPSCAIVAVVSVLAMSNCSPAGPNFV